MAHHSFDTIVPQAGLTCNEGGSGHCLQDSSLITFNHTEYMIANSVMQAPTLNRMNAVYDPLVDFNVSYEDPVKLTGDWETDIIFAWNPNLPSGAYGQTVCDDDSVGNDECDQFYVYYDEETIIDDWGQSSTSIYRKIACHEVGHAVGLLHAANSSPSGMADPGPHIGCMTRYHNAGYTNFTVLGEHNVGEIDETYPH